MATNSPFDESSISLNTPPNIAQVPLNFNSTTPKEKISISKNHILATQVTKEIISKFNQDFTARKSHFEFLRYNSLIDPVICLNLENYITKCNFLIDDLRYRILLTGPYNSGKSSFLNSLIGYDLIHYEKMPTTKTLLIVRHHDNKEPKLFRTKINSIFINNSPIKENPFLMECGELIAKGPSAVSEKIIEINNQFNMMRSYEEMINNTYILYVKLPVIAALEKQIKFKIDLLDLPGFGCESINKTEKLLSFYFEFEKKIFKSIDQELVDRAWNIYQTKNTQGKDSYSNLLNIKRNQILFFMSFENIFDEKHTEIMSLLENYRQYLDVNFIFNKMDLINKSNVGSLMSLMDERLFIFKNQDDLQNVNWLKKGNQNEGNLLFNLNIIF
jgi:GTP-binding protein EngB required for normal cell division